MVEKNIGEQPITLGLLSGLYWDAHREHGSDYLQSPFGMMTAVRMRSQRLEQCEELYYASHDHHRTLLIQLRLFDAPLVADDTLGRNVIQFDFRDEPA